jgi:hypothetical protein
MAKLKLGSFHNDKPVKVTVELPAEVQRDLKAYADIISQEIQQEVKDPTKLIAPMLKQFMATDRTFRRLRRRAVQDSEG